MKICAESFEDEEIRSFINSFGNSSVDLTELVDFFTDFIGLFKLDANGRSIVRQIQDDWHIFTSDDDAIKILSEVIRLQNLKISIKDTVSYIPEIESCFTEWKSLKEDVKYNKRFFSDLRNFGWVQFISSCNAEIEKDSKLYRARITPDDIGVYSAKEMGCPPKEKATSGRANPSGIPYLYLCSDVETTLYEVRSVLLDKISVGTFKVKNKLNIVDFSNEINLFYAYSITDSNMELSDIVRKKIIFDQISKDLSKPLRRFDSEVEYVPTQLICEYCKINGADGIRFRSSLHNSGRNTVLFNGNDAVECDEVRLVEIIEVAIKGR